MTEAPETDARAAPGAEPATRGMPRWVKAFILVVIVLVLAAIGVSLLFGIEHGPNLHRPPESPGGHTPFMEHGP
ncbi:MAG TPA: hypothetical protein VG602_08420 [Actinomycetota bacterium]|nr:hypothetical protein [Actinomycetota bacterium]